VVAGTLIFVIPLLAAISALVGPYSLLPYVAVVGCLIVFMLPLETVLITTLFIAAIAAGSLEYFGGASQGFWLPYLLGVLLALRGVVERLRFRSSPIRSREFSRQKPNNNAAFVSIFAFLYFSVALFGLAITLPPLQQLVVGVKNYFFVWGVLLVLIWSPWQIASSTRFWTAVVVIASLQWPVAMYQRFIVAARRHDTAAWDSVVGTFGGDPSGGGNSAAMAFVCCVAVAVLALRMRDKQLKVVVGVPMLLLCMAPIALAEVKAAFVWLTVVFLILTWQYFRREPIRAIGSALIGFILLAGLGFIYVAAYKDQMGTSTTLESIYDKQIKYSVDPNEFSSQYKRLGRVTSLVYWWSQHDVTTNPVEMLFGHGLGASRSVSSLGTSQLARRLPFAVDGTAASALLWDVGLLGCLSFVLVLAAAGLGSLRLSRDLKMPLEWRETTVLSSIVLLSLLVGILYNKDAIDNASLQILLMFALGQFLIARRLIERSKRGTPA
jgi:hypothetical protein